MKKMSYPFEPNPPILFRVKVGKQVALYLDTSFIEQGDKLMLKRVEKLSCIFVIKNLALAGCLFGASRINAQEYNFSFYNGDVVQTPTQTLQTVQPKQQVIATPQQPVVVTPVQQITKEEEEVADPQKSVRTGLAFLGGYSNESFRNGDEDISKLTGNTTRLGVSFISQYDYNFDVELLFTKFKADTAFGRYSGDAVAGLSMGSRHNYWINDQVALTMGGSLRGYNGELENGVTLTSIGGRLGAGPVIQMGKHAQLLLTYEYGLDRVRIKDTNFDQTYDSSWNQNSSLKAMLAYRF